MLLLHKIKNTGYHYHNVKEADSGVGLHISQINLTDNIIHDVIVLTYVP